MMKTVKTSLSHMRAFWSNYKQDRTAVLGLIIVAFISIIAILAPVIAPEGPYTQSLNFLMPPSSTYPMGTDNLGRNVFNQVIWGARVSLLFGFCAAGISFIIGTLIGALAGFYGGVIDDLLSRTTEVFMLLPRLFLIIMLISLYGSNIIMAIAVVGFTIWPSNARLMRAQALTIKKRGYVMAAFGSGTSRIRILFKHVLPNGIQPVIVNTSFMVGNAIMLEAGLSFLGLGDPNKMSWGQILKLARYYVRTGPWLAIFPGIAIIFLVWSFYSIGDGINYALNPRLTER